MALSHPSGVEPATDQVTVLVVDDHPVVVQGTARILEEYGLTVVGTATSVNETLRAIENIEAQVILLDIALGDGDAFALMPKLRLQAPQSRVLLLSGYDYMEYIVAAQSSGAWGYLLKSAEPGFLAEAVRQVAQGNRVFSPEITIRFNDWKKDADSLTPRELEILRLIADGWKNEAIAKQLGLSRRTVETHIRTLFNRLQVSSRIDAVRVAWLRGIL